MGTVFSVCEGCSPKKGTPVDYIESAMKKKNRSKKVLNRKKIDVMGAALDSAINDIIGMMGV